MTLPRRDLSARAAELQARRVPFVRARVVLAESPTSAKPGDEAIVLGDGTIEGFVGGTCAESTVRERSMALLQSGGTLLLRVSPDPEPEQPGKLTIHNPCLSGGTIEVYLEAERPAPLVVVSGRAPIADSLRELGAALGYDPAPFSGTLAPDTAAVVVASHGGDEEKLLRAALEAGVPYVALVASRRRGRAVVEALPVPDEAKARVHTPAGLDIGATTPGEVALSILAEMVAAGLGHGGGSRPSHVPARAVEAVTDPVCGMTVLPGETALHTESAGRTWWFCGRGCLEAFVANPASYQG